MEWKPGNIGVILGDYPKNGASKEEMEHELETGIT